MRGVLRGGVQSATPDDDHDGPVPITACLAAVGGRLARNLWLVAEATRVAFDALELRLAADRSDDPPSISAVRLDAELASRAPRDRAARCVVPAIGNGTISRTVARRAPFEAHLTLNRRPLELPDDILDHALLPAPGGMETVR